MKKTLLTLSTALLAAYAGNAQLVNGNMENWHDYTVSGIALQAPQGWRGLDSNIAAIGPFVSPQQQNFKSTSVHGGSFAARLVSKTNNFAGFVVPGVLANGDITLIITPDVDYYISGGTPVTDRSASVSAWVKYTPAAGSTDSGVIFARAILQGTMGADGRDSVIGEGTMAIGSTAAYTQKTVPIVYTNPTRTPTHIQIGFLSSNLATAADGSELFVDDVVLNAASGISKNLHLAAVVKCYPNPTNGMLNFSSNEPGVLHLEAISATGQVIAQQSFTGNTALDLANQPAGTYYFRVSDKNNQLLQTGKFTRK